jgi:hypothetical protein
LACGGRGGRVSRGGCCEGRGFGAVAAATVTGAPASPRPAPRRRRRRRAVRSTSEGGAAVCCCGGRTCGGRCACAPRCCDRDGRPSRPPSRCCCFCGLASGFGGRPPPAPPASRRVSFLPVRCSNS